MVVQRISEKLSFANVTLKFYDDDGYPADQSRDWHSFEKNGDFHKFKFYLMTKNYTIEVD